jgi:hypothetical protein
MLSPVRKSLCSSPCSHLSALSPFLPSMFTSSCHVCACMAGACTYAPCGLGHQTWASQVMFQPGFVKCVRIISQLWCLINTAVGYYCISSDWTWDGMEATLLLLCITLCTHHSAPALCLESTPPLHRADCFPVRAQPGAGGAGGERGVPVRLPGPTPHPACGCG